MMFIGVCDVVADLCGDFVYMWISVSGGREAESVSVDGEPLGDFTQVGRHVRDET